MSEGLFQVPGVEIFAAGNHRGKNYTPADLDQIVANFEQFSSPKSQNKLLAVPTVLGHEEGQEMLKRSDLPAAGWPTRIWREGNILFADIGEMPQQVAKAVNDRAFRKVSSEIYDDPPEGIPGAGKMLRRIAFLGGEIPHVKGLADIPRPVMYSESERLSQPTHAPQDLRLTSVEQINDANGEACFACFSEPYRPGLRTFADEAPAPAPNYFLNDARRQAIRRWVPGLPDDMGDADMANAAMGHRVFGAAFRRALRQPLNQDLDIVPPVDTAGVDRSPPKFSERDLTAYAEDLIKSHRSWKHAEIPIAGKNRFGSPSVGAGVPSGAQRAYPRTSTNTYHPVGGSGGGTAARQLQQGQQQRAANYDEVEEPDEGPKLVDDSGPTNTRRKRPWRPALSGPVAIAASPAHRAAGVAHMKGMLFRPDDNTQPDETRIGTKDLGTTQHATNLLLDPKNWTPPGHHGSSPLEPPPKPPEPPEAHKEKNRQFAEAARRGRARSYREWLRKYDEPGRVRGNLPEEPGQTPPGEHPVYVRGQRLPSGHYTGGHGNTIDPELEAGLVHHGVWEPTPAGHARVRRTADDPHDHPATYPHHMLYDPATNQPLARHNERGRASYYREWLRRFDEGGPKRGGERRTPKEDQHVRTREGREGQVVSNLGRRSTVYGPKHGYSGAHDNTSLVDEFGRPFHYDERRPVPAGSQVSVRLPRPRPSAPLDTELVPGQAIESAGTMARVRRSDQPAGSHPFWYLNQRIQDPSGQAHHAEDPSYGALLRTGQYQRQMGSAMFSPGDLPGGHRRRRNYQEPGATPMTPQNTGYGGGMAAPQQFQDMPLRPMPPASNRDPAQFGGGGMGGGMGGAPLRSEDSSLGDMGGFDPEDLGGLGDDGDMDTSGPGQMGGDRKSDLLRQLAEHGMDTSALENQPEEVLAEVLRLLESKAELGGEPEGDPSGMPGMPPPGEVPPGGMGDPAMTGGGPGSIEEPPEDENDWPEPQNDEERKKFSEKAHRFFDRTRKFFERARRYKERYCSTSEGQGGDSDRQRRAASLSNQGVHMPAVSRFSETEVVALANEIARRIDAKADAAVGRLNKYTEEITTAEKKRGVVAMVDTWILQGKVYPRNKENVIKRLLRADDKVGVEKFGEGASARMMTDFDLQVKEIEGTPRLFTEKMMVQHAGTEAAKFGESEDPEVEKVAAHFEAFSEGFAEVNISREEWVETFAARRKKDPKFTASRYIDPAGMNGRNGHG